MRPDRRPQPHLADLVTISYRQLDYWCRTGAFGITHRNVGVGSGNQRDWTRREVRALNTIGAVIDDLRQLGAAGGTVELVGDLWRQFIDDGLDVASIRLGRLNVPIPLGPDPADDPTAYLPDEEPE